MHLYINRMFNKIFKINENSKNVYILILRKYLCKSIFEIIEMKLNNYK